MPGVGACDVLQRLLLDRQCTVPSQLMHNAIARLSALGADQEDGHAQAALTPHGDATACGQPTACAATQSMPALWDRELV